MLETAQHISDVCAVSSFGSLHAGLGANLDAEGLFANEEQGVI